MGFLLQPTIGIACTGFDIEPACQGASTLLQEGTVEVLCVGHKRKFN